MFSRKLRIKFGLPPNGPLSLTKDEQARLKQIEAKYSKRKGTSGMKLERLFLKAWKKLGQYDKLVKNVRRATPQEDLFEMTDAVMTMLSGRIVKIQLTRRMPNRVSYELEFDRHGKEKVVLVELTEDQDYAAIRTNTISAVSRYLQKY